MQHKHIYDVKGKQLCCTQQGKIYTNAGASSLLEDGHSKKDGHNHSEHSDEDGHDHSKGNDSVVKMFLPTMISLCLLLIAIAFDNYFPQSWFTGYIRLGWYILAYIPVGFPVV